MLQADVIGNVTLASSSDHFLAYGQIQKKILVHLLQHVHSTLGQAMLPDCFMGLT